MSPLDQIGVPFSLELMNPNVKANKLKDGMRYRVEFEILKDVFDEFAAANTTGMILEGELQVTHLSNTSANTPAIAANDSSEDELTAAYDRARDEFKADPERVEQAEKHVAKMAEIFREHNPSFKDEEAIKLNEARRRLMDDSDL